MTTEMTREDHVETAIVAAIRAGCTTTAAISQRVHRHPDTVRVDLRRLERRDIVARTGAARKTRWHVTDDVLQFVPDRRKRLDQEIAAVEAYLALLRDMRESL